MIKYIKVLALMDEFGNVSPKSIFWENGKEYQIDKINSIKNLASTKGGGVGIRYEVKIKGQTRFLFLYEYKWFVELD